MQSKLPALIVIACVTAKMAKAAEISNTDIQVVPVTRQPASTRPADSTLEVIPVTLASPTNRTVRTTTTLKTTTPPLRTCVVVTAYTVRPPTGAASALVIPSFTGFFFLVLAVLVFTCAASS
ncbi:hypothetical protein F4861DRAFT_519147 [Xylaria intraflava]|nr:hypothetical protein F4861DRAFT_519147 [Xylaria intraflava]